MIHNLREAFNDLLNENDWMDESTRKVARVKVSQVIFLTEDVDSFVSQMINIIHLSRFRRML